MKRKQRQATDPMTQFAAALRANYFCTSKLTDVEIEDGWRLCSCVGACPRVPKGWVATLPHAHREQCVSACDYHEAGGDRARPCSSPMADKRKRALAANVSCGNEFPGQPGNMYYCSQACNDAGEHVNGGHLCVDIDYPPGPGARARGKAVR